MGEYADDYFRREVKGKFGFDPGSMYQEDEKKVQCKVCSKKVKETGLANHMKDKHGSANQKV